MKFGAVFLATYPSATIVEQCALAEECGFDAVWINDNHVSNESCWPVLTLVARETSHVQLGPYVTNPTVREWSETAGLVATLSEISGGRVALGMGTGDAGVRLLGARPAPAAQLEQAVHYIRDLVGGRSATTPGGTTVSLKWWGGTELEVFGAANGPRALAAIGRSCDGLIFQSANPDLARNAYETARKARVDAGLDPATFSLQVGGPGYVTDDLARGLEQTRWFGATVLNHLARQVRLHSADQLPPRLVELAVQRGLELDQEQRSLPGNTGASWVPDWAVDELAVVGPPERHIERLKRLIDLGATQFNLYCIHNNVTETLKAYGDEIIPALAGL